MRRRKLPRWLGIGFQLVLCFTHAPALAAGVHASSYEVDVRCVPESAFLEGSSRIGLREANEPAEVLRFWLHGELRVSQVTAGRDSLEFSQNREYYPYDYSLVGNRVEVGLPNGKVPGSIEVKWSGDFHRSSARSPSDYMRIDESGVFLRAFGYSPWFPIFLEVGEDEYDVAFHRVSVEVPEKFTAVFAGDFLHSKNDAGMTRYEWYAASLPLHAAQLTARPFTVMRQGDVRIYSLNDPQSLASAEKIVNLTRSLLDYFRMHYRADAVAGQVHVVETPEYGDISSLNVVGIQEGRWRSVDNAEDATETLAHELVHPFVQLTVSRNDPLYALMIEALPSYFHYPALDALGKGDYRVRISRIRDSYIDKRITGRDRRGRRLPQEKAISRITADEIGVYKDRFILSDRAILFLDEVKARMGDVSFDEFSRELFASASMNDREFRRLVLRRLPDFEDDLTMWLDTTELPDQAGR